MKFYNSIFGLIKKFQDTVARGGFDDALLATVSTISNTFDLYNEQECELNFVSEFYPSFNKQKNLLQIELPGYSLLVSKDDPGISYDLMIRGIREYRSYWQYRRLLKKLPKNPLILEIGANIGYYAIAAAVDRPDATVLCAELDPGNIEILNKNIKLNKLNNLIVENIAISDVNDYKNFVRDSRSNRHYLEAPGINSDNLVETVTGNNFLSDFGYSQNEVNCLRMDVEGHETEVLSGLRNIRPELAHIELHPYKIHPTKWKSMITQLHSWDSKPIFVEFKGKCIKCANIRDIPAHDYCVVVLSSD